ncbi:MAG: MBL fold metallo-hydrolase [Eubacteriales bacterium]|nr:MBL fold metallo-hydrolase [Eubacteriales bacterium]
MRMMTIASGSSGNCIYVGSEETHILIDAGISRKKIEEGLHNANLTLKDISAVFVTHEHSDHIKGLGVMSRKHNIPVYSTKGTIDGILSTAALGELNSDLFCPMERESDILIGDLCVHSFKVSHDANDPVAYTVSCGEKKAGIVTDLGYYDDYIVDNLKGADMMLVEANHDVNLLQVGSYPYYLKQRILGTRGHLSNESSGQLINSLLHDNIKKILLGHLSKENNYDKLAYETVRLEIDMGDNKFMSKDFDIDVAKRSEPSEIIEL